MKYSSQPVSVGVSPLALPTRRYRIGEMRKPFDVKLGWTDTIWFTGAHNAIGRLDAARTPLVYPRSTGVRPHILMEGWGPGDERVFWFTDPEGDAIGRINMRGDYLPDIATGPGTAPTPIGEPGLRPVLIGTRTGSSVYTVSGHDVIALHCPDSRIDAVSWGPDRMIWYVSGSMIQCMDPDGVAGQRCELPAGARIDELVQRTSDDSLYYCDSQRDVIGWIKDRESVIEYQLPAGVSPRAITVGRNLNPWFTGRGGRSLFQLEYGRVVEYPCANASSDLTRLVYTWDQRNTFWCTEPGADCVCSVSVYGH
jgi:streptogramin lyase